MLADAAVTSIAGAVVAAEDPDAMEDRWTQLGLDRDVRSSPPDARGDGLDEVELVAADRTRVGERTEIGGVTFTLV